MAGLCWSGLAADGTYTVRPGDTLGALASRLGTSVRALADTNGIGNPDLIIIGQTLQVPGAGVVGGGGGTHVVRPGETLATIAARHGLTARALADANGITDANLVMAGSRIRLGGRAAPAVATGAGLTSVHVVQPGETLGGIANRLGVGTSALASANGIRDPNRLSVGARLTVPNSWTCPVQGTNRFVNDFGVPKPDGRFHEGVDVYAAQGTPLVASVSGRVEQVDGTRGGLQYWLYGDDGTLYIGTHLDRLAAGGQVSAGTIVGWVGTSGNARGSPPHLHFEMHPGGAGTPAVNPYPTLRAACG